MDFSHSHQKLYSKGWVFPREGNATPSSSVWTKLSKSMSSSLKRVRQVASPARHPYDLTGWLRLSSLHFVVIIKLNSLLETGSVAKLKSPYKPEAFSSTSFFYSPLWVYKIGNTDKLKHCQDFDSSYSDSMRNSLPEEINNPDVFFYFSEEKQLKKKAELA